MLTDRLLPASFRGVPFAVLSSGVTGGRRIALHQYPGKDEPWAEDMGREVRAFPFRGFLVNEDRIYAGGPIAAQRALLIAAFEREGAGLLTHPTLGLISASVRRFSIGEDIAGATYSDFDVEFIESGKRTFPTILTSSSGLLSAASLCLVAIAADVARAVQLATARGGQRGDLQTTSRQWSDRVVASSSDATALSRLSAQLTGNYGRYASGANEGVAGATYSSYASATIADLAAAASAQRATVAVAARLVAASIDELTIGTVEADIAAAVAVLVTALVAACADPADALRLLLRLLAFAPIGPEAVSAMGVQITELYRRTIVAALAQAAAIYQPSSYDDAVAKIVTIVAAIDDEITTAGDQGADDTFQQLRALRASVVADLRARGGSLAPVRTFTFGRPLPALTLAQRLYRDAGRAEQLVGQVEIASPLFMPPTFQALAA